MAENNTEAPPILSEVRFRARGAYVEIKAIGEPMDTDMCDDIIKMLEAQKVVLTESN